MWSTSKSIRLGAGLALVLATSLPGTVAVAAQAASTQDTLCEALSAAEINALSQIEWAEPVHADPQRCVFWPASADNGQSSVVLSLSDRRTLDESRGSLEGAEDVTVEGRPGILFETRRDGTLVLVGLGEFVLQAQADLVGWPEAEGVDPNAYVLAIAEVAVANLEAGLGDEAMAEATEPLSAEGALCDSISTAELNSLGSLQYGEPLVASEKFCVFEQSTAQAGPHIVSLSIAPTIFTLDMARAQFPEATEVAIGDHPVVIGEDSLNVGLDDLVLVIQANVAESAEGEGIDPIEYALDVATIVLANIDEAEADRPPEVLSTTTEPPDVAGAGWRVGSLQTGDEFEGLSADEDTLGSAILLEAAGAGYDRLSLRNASHELGSYLAIRLAGTDESRLRSAVLEWLPQSTGSDDLSVEEIEMGGKSVTKIALSPEQVAYVYFSGDTFVLISLPGEAAAELLSLLP